MQVGSYLVICLGARFGSLVGVGKGFFSGTKDEEVGEQERRSVFLGGLKGVGLL